MHLHMFVSYAQLMITPNLRTCVISSLLYCKTCSNITLCLSQLLFSSSWHHSYKEAKVFYSRCQVCRWLSTSAFHSLASLDSVVPMDHSRFAQPAFSLPSSWASREACVQKTRHAFFFRSNDPKAKQCHSTFPLFPFHWFKDFLWLQL